MKRETVRFDSLYSVESRNGLTKPSKVRGSGYKMINMGELFSNDRIYDIPMELVPLKETEKVCAVQPLDLLFARQSLVLEGAGKCCIVMETSPLTVFESHLIRVRLNLEKANPIFFYYYFKSPYSPVKTIVSQCAQAGIRGSDLSQLKVICPPLSIQNRIAEMLSAYDDLIENNQKQIKLLEEAAQRLYKEWFIDLRFPGYETTPVVDGVPEGWKYQTVSDYGDVITGKTPSTDIADFYGGTIPFVKIPDMHRGIFPVVTETTLTKSGAESQKNKYLPRNSLMVSCIATVGLVNISVEKCQTNQQINSIVLNDERDLYYLFFRMKDIKEILEGLGSNGATMTNVNKAKFSKLPILHPTDRTRDEFRAFCAPVFDRILLLTRANKQLVEARDYLLPKLMSGEIEV